MGDKTVLLDIAGGIATVTLNRPAAMNTFDDKLVPELIATLTRLGDNPQTRVIVLTGSGKAFCAGGDLLFLDTLRDQLAARRFIADVGKIAALIMNLEKPVIAMVNGVAAGAGFNLALACDIIFAAKTARFAQSFIKVGLVPDCGGLFLLPRVAGLHKAKELMFTADLIDAYTALKLGLLNHVIEDEALKEETYKFAARVAAGAPLALGFMKRILNRSDTLDLATALEFETDLQTICMQTADHQEGVAAFRAKRAPVFKGI